VSFQIGLVISTVKDEDNISEFVPNIFVALTSTLTKPSSIFL